MIHGQEAAYEGVVITIEQAATKAMS